METLARAGSSNRLRRGRASLSNWQIVAAAALAVACAMAALHSLRRPPETESVETLARRLPRERAAIFHANTGILRSAGLLAALGGALNGQEREYRQFVAETNFDYLRDMDRLVLSIGRDDTAAVVAGRWDQERLQHYAAAHNGTCRDATCSLPASRPGRRIWFRLVSNRLLVLAVSARPEPLRTLVEGRAGEAQTGTLPWPSEPVWLYVPKPVWNDRELVPRAAWPMAGLLSPADHVTLALGGGPHVFPLSFQVVAVCEAPQAAGQLARQGAQLIKALRDRQTSKSRGEPSLAVFLAQGEVRQDGNSVVGSWPVDRQTLGQLLQ